MIVLAEVGFGVYFCRQWSTDRTVWWGCGRMTPERGRLEFCIDEDEESPQVNSSTQKSASECVHVQPRTANLCFVQAREGSDNTNVRRQRHTKGLKESHVASASFPRALAKHSLPTMARLDGSYIYIQHTSVLTDNVVIYINKQLYIITEGQ